MDNGFENSYDSSTDVDIVFCLDSSERMSHLINIVIENALGFYADLDKRAEEKNKQIRNVRVCLIVYRDYQIDREHAMMILPFLSLPEKNDVFRTSVRSLVAQGGGKSANDGLEALNYAMIQEWNNKSLRKRHIIVMCSDKDANDMGHGSQAYNYPQNLAADFKKLSDLWGSNTSPGIMDEEAKRLLLFVPDTDNWNRLYRNWNKTFWFEAGLGKGFVDVDYETMLDSIISVV